MSVDITSNKEINYTANLDIEQVLQQSAILKDEFKSLGEELSNSFDVKPLTAYEAGLQNIKQAFLDLAKEKAEYEKADKAASMAIQSALKEERELVKQRNAELKNNAGETKNAKGLIEQKQAAIVRLNKVYSNLNATEKNSAGGQRLQGIISGLTAQVKTLDTETDKAQSKAASHGSKVGSGLGKLGEGFKKLIGSIPGLGLAEVVGLLVEPIIEAIKNLDIFKTKLDDTVKISAASSSEYTKALSDVGNLKTSVEEFKEGTITKTELVDRFNESIGKNVGELKTAQEVEDFYTKKSDDYIKAVYLKAQAHAALEVSAKKASEALTKQIEGPSLTDQVIGWAAAVASLGGGATALQVTTNLHADGIIKLNDESKKAAAIADQKTKEYDAFLKSKGLNKPNPGNETKTGNKPIDSEINEQRSLQEKISELKKESNRKQLSQEESEIQAVKDKYAKISKEIDAFNAKYKGKLKVNSKGLADDEKNEIKLIEGKEETNRTKSFLDEQQALYSKYEEFKAQVGIKKANERYGKELDVNANYLKELKIREGTLMEKKDRTAPENDLLKDIQSRIAKEVELEKSKNDTIYINAFNATKTLTQKILDVNNEFERDKLALGENASKENIAILERTRDKSISALASAELTDSDVWAKLFGNLDDLTKTELDTLIKEVETKFSSLSKSLNPIDLAELQKKLKEAKSKMISDNPFVVIGQAIKELNEKNVGGVKKSSDQIKGDWVNLAKATEGAFKFVDDIVQSTDFLKEAIGEVGQTAISSLATVASVSVAVGQAIKSTEKASIVLAIIQAALAVAQAISNVLKSIFNANDKKIEKSIEGHKDKVEELTNSYADLERAVASAIGEDIYRKQQQQIENLKSQQDELVKIRDAEASKKKPDQGKINEYNQQIKEAGQKIIDVNNQIAESLIQTNFKELSSSFADALTEAFKTASDQGLAFDKVFNDVVANAIKNGLKIKLLEPVIAEFTSALADYAKNNGNSVVGFDFETYRKKLKEQANLFNAGLAASGDFFMPQSENKFLKNVGESYLKSLESSDYAKRVSEYHEKLAEATKRGLTAADLDSFKAEYEALSALAKQKMDEYEKLTGQKIEIDPISLQFNVDSSSAEEGLQSLRDKLFENLTKSAEETGKSIEEILKDHILQALKSQILTDGLKPLQQKITALYANGKIPTKDEIAALTAEMNAFIDGAKSKLKDIESATGLTFGDAVKAIDSELQSISDSIADVFANTDGALQNFEEKFNGMVKNTILESLKTTLLSDKLTDFYNGFKKLSTVDDAKKQEQIALLRAQYNEIIKEGKDEYERLQDVFGVDYSTPKQDQSAISSSVGRSITEDTANVLAGTFVGIYDEVKKSSGWLGKIYSISTQNLDTAIRTEQNTRRTADNTEGVGAKLDQIIANTKKSTSTSLSDTYLKL